MTDSSAAGGAAGASGILYAPWGFALCLIAMLMGDVLIYFFGTWVELVLNGLGVHYPALATAQQVATNRRIFWLLVIGTIPGAIVGAKFERFIEDTWRNPGPIAAAVIGVAVLNPTGTDCVLAVGAGGAATVMLTVAGALTVPLVAVNVKLSAPL